MQEWWRVLGYSSNPLEIRPKEPLYGLEKQEQKIIDSIMNGEIILVYGPFGSGKTSLALRIKKKISNRFHVIYLNGEQNPNPDIYKIIEKFRYSFRLLSFKIPSKKKIVLILDEVQNMDPSVFKVVKAYYDSGIIYSVVLIQIPPELSNATPSFKNRISKKIEIDFPDEDTIVKIIKSRLGDRLEVDERLIRKLARIHGNNVRSVLISLNNLIAEYRDKIKDRKLYIEFLSDSVESNEKVKVNIDVDLSEQQKQIIKPILLSALSIKEIARVTGLPYNSVSKQISRLKRKGIVINTGSGKESRYIVNPDIKDTLIRLLGE